jgi:hypothetical protein
MTAAPGRFTCARPARRCCFGCPYLNFSRSRSELDLAARRAIKELEGCEDRVPEEYSRKAAERYNAMVDCIRRRLNLTTLRYQRLEDLIAAIGFPAEKVCPIAGTAAPGMNRRRAGQRRGIRY